MFIYLLIVFFIVSYFYLIRNHKHWAKKNVKHEKPVPLFGNHFKNFFAIRSIADVCQELYDKYEDEKVIGYYRGNTPELIIKDPDLVRQVLTVDFNNFYKRGMKHQNTEKDPLLLNLFHVEGDKWKLLRQRLTGAFTTIKLKNMFPLIIRCAEKLQNVTEELAANEKEYDARELMARFTTEFIGAVGFGVEMDTINDERSQFRKIGKQIFEPPLKAFFLNGLNELFPELTKNMYAGDAEMEVTMKDLFMKIYNQRNGKPIGRNDLIDLLLELESIGKIEGESLELMNPDGTPAKVSLDMDMNVMMAQMYVFFGAGFETSSSSTSFCLHELAFNPEIQAKVQEEIDEVMSKYDNKLSYEAISEMNLLERTFKEALRMYPPLGVLNRECTRKYTIPGLDITVEPGTKILIPVHALQNDERYFESPKQFNPDRFLPEELKRRHKFVYLPFGEGPRNCIGARLGYMQSLAGLAAILHKFSFEPSTSTKRHLENRPSSNMVQAVKDGIPLKITRRKNV